jgi:thymidine kinase
MKERQPERRIVTPQLEVIAGPMYSGKTEELIRRLVRAEIAKFKVQAFKPKIDNRYNPKKISSHSKSEHAAILVDHTRPKSILESVQEDTQVIGIEEVQFFGSEIVEVCETLVSMGKRVIVAGLPSDFKNEPFGPMPILLAKADKVDRIHAVCMTCGGDADFTQRIVNGKPASYNDPIVLVGASEAYEARCRSHHEVLDNPNKK